MHAYIHVDVLVRSDGGKIHLITVESTGASGNMGVCYEDSFWIQKKKKNSVVWGC
jgi:hypothetical protein